MLPWRYSQLSADAKYGLATSDVSRDDPPMARPKSDSPALIDLPPPGPPTDRFEKRARRRGATVVAGVDDPQIAFAVDRDASWFFELAVACTNGAELPYEGGRDVDAPPTGREKTRPYTGELAHRGR